MSRDLSTAGFNVNVVALDKKPYNDAAVVGNFSMIFTETWGSPYDPHTTAAAWRVPNEADFAAQAGMVAPMTKAQLNGNVTAALVSSPEQLPAIWANILSGLHANAIYAPIASVANLAVVSTKLAGFRMGVQQFDVALALRKVSILATPSAGTSSPTQNQDAVIAVAVLVPSLVLLGLSMAYFIYRERAGSPLFTPLMQDEKKVWTSSDSATV